MFKLYKKIQNKSERLKRHEHAFFGLRQSRFLMYKTMLSALELLIIITKDAGTSFRVMFAPEEGQREASCQLSYRSFRGIYRNVRIFFATATISMLTLISFLVLDCESSFCKVFML